MSSMTESGNSNCVFLALRDGIHLRNFANRDMIRCLENSGLTFVLLVSEPNHPQLRKQFSAPCFKFEKMQVAALDIAMRAGRLAPLLRTARRYALGGTWLWKIASMRCLAKIQWRTQSKRSSLFGKIQLLLMFFVAVIIGRFKIARMMLRKIEARLSPFDRHAELYERYRPAVTVVASFGYLYDALLMREANKFGARVAVAIKNWDVPTTKGVGGAIPDHLFVWNNTMCEEMIKHHDVPRERIKITGITQWDHYFDQSISRSRAVLCSRYDIPTDRKIIYFATTSPIFYDDNFTIARMLLDSIRNCQIVENAHLLIRLHPQYFDLKESHLATGIAMELDELTRDYGDILSLSVPSFAHDGGLQIIEAKEELLLRDILACSDAMVTIYSTQIIEATFFDLPVINIGMHQFRGTDEPMGVCATWPHNQQITDLDGTTDCATAEEVINALNSDLKHRHRLAEGRMRIADKILPTHLRGVGGETLGEALIKVATG
jgi:hypothetical protein